MEALALLCTLHADGPSTLKRLRRGGCNSLRAVEDLPAEELARLVGISASTARRFVREATNLRQRLAPGEEAPSLDVEEVPEFLDADPIQAPVGAALDQRDELAMERMLAVPMAEPPIEEPRGEQVEVFQQAERESEPIPETVRDSNPGLEPGAVDGLDRELIDVLARQGVASLWDLANLDAGALARSSGVAFGRLTRIRFLARRENPEPPPEQLPKEESKHSDEIWIDLREEPVVIESKAVEPEAIDWQPLELEPVDPEPVDLAAEQADLENAPPVEDWQSEDEDSPMPGTPTTLYVAPSAYEQPVPLDGDPTQRPPFWEVREEWRAGAHRVNEQEVQEELPATDALPESGAPSTAEVPFTSTTLGWDFKVPTPPGYLAPSSYPPVHLPKAAHVRIDRLTEGDNAGASASPDELCTGSDEPDEGIAGPFA
ncbi:MAG TPA: helix-hairpin-helix domain-containing protein [Planctomycetes bacterium]|nr:helix-hairpin-helix domain-containing protein [Planctomycetota bacterium]HIL37772.1 helix-hairpin-helix domain-containing protein [Planctomycetota bacterium]